LLNLGYNFTIKILDAAMKRKINFGKIFFFIIVAYLCIGLVYSLAGYAQNVIDAKAVVFSPLIGIPLDMLGWPLSLRGDYINAFLDMQFFVTLAAILLAFILFLRMVFRAKSNIDG